MPVFASIGECMVELSSAGDGLYRRGFAGDTFNTAWTLRGLTDPGAIRVRYVTGAGSDPLSDDLLRFIEGAGIEPVARRVTGRTVGLYMITLDGHERSFAYWRDTSAARLLAEDRAALTRALEDADCVYFSGITLAILTPEHRRTLLTALDAVRGRGGMVAFDPNIRPALWADQAELRAEIEAGCRVATVALPTFPDERDLFDDASIEACAARIAGYGVSEVVVKNGADPALVCLGEEAVGIPAIEVANPLDTTGAGDSFNAGYLAARLAGAAPVEATRNGHRTAARVVQSHGALVDLAALRALRGGDDQ
ncbi:sugar kinase [Amaricoccus sp.]|uniref:sugar kinase n=1 Tax=Amaricoccus sp. TaxID=1872485 RepID=UPI001B3F6E0B|nr:sugar kinase [Amaricoccus sp.]MBP7002695.1 sugar kinase [Amaricoccus sp.]